MAPFLESFILLHTYQQISKIYAVSHLLNFSPKYSTKINHYNSQSSTHATLARLQLPLSQSISWHSWVFPGSFEIIFYNFYFLTKKSSNCRHSRRRCSTSTTLPEKLLGRLRSLAHTGTTWSQFKRRSSESIISYTGKGPESCSDGP